MKRPTNKAIDMVWQKGLDALKPSKTNLEHGLELHERFVVCDSFGFMPAIWTPEIFDGLNRMVDQGASVQEWGRQATYLRMHCMTRDRQGAQEFVEALQASGVSCIVHNVGGIGPPDVSLQNMAARTHACRVFRKYMFQAGGSDEIREAKQQRRTAIIWSVNGPPGMQNSQADMLKWLEVWYQLGVRLMHLSYNRRNSIAGGCTEERDDGLSDFGKEYVRKMNEVGVIVDVPHSSRQTTLDAARISVKPIMASHTGSKRVFDHPRCKDDEELKAIASTGGMIGVFCVPSLLGKDAKLTTVLDHLDAVVKVIGADHVSLGTDVSYCRAWPAEIKRHHAATFGAEQKRIAGGWKPEHFSFATEEHINGSLGWSNWPLFTTGMVMRGYSDGDIEKILGKNLMRVLDANRSENEVSL